MYTDTYLYMIYDLSTLALDDAYVYTTCCIRSCKHAY